MGLILTTGVRGAFHAFTVPDPTPPPTRVEYTLQDARSPFRKRMHYTDRPGPVLSAPVESDAVVWGKIQGSAATSARDYLLRVIADGTKFSRSDANRLVFGSGLKKSEQHRNFLTDTGGFRFDSYVHDIAVPDFYPESYEWDGSTRGDVESTWQSELKSLVSSCLSSKHARSILIEQFRAVESSQFEALPF